MMLLGEFHELVSADLARGTSLDNEIPRRTQMAVGWIERNYSFQYMRRWLTLTIDSGSDNPEVISLAGLRLKKIEALRRVSEDTDGTKRFTDLEGPIDPKRRTTRPSGLPSSFWLDGVSNLVLDSIPNENLTCEMHAVLYTDWPTDNDSFTHWLLDNAVDLLLPVTLLNMASRARDPKLFQMYSTQVELALKSINLGEEEFRFGEAPDQQMWSPNGYAFLSEDDPGRDS